MWFIGWDYAHAFDYSGLYMEDYPSINDKCKKWTTEEIIEDGTFQGTYRYFVDSRWYNSECTETNNTEIWWDKFALQELINNCADEYQRKITEMLDVLKD